MQAETEEEVYASFGIKPVQQDPAMQAIIVEKEEEVNASNATPPTQQNPTEHEEDNRPWRALKSLSWGRNQQNGSDFNSRIMIGRLWRGRGCGEDGDGDGNGRERGGVVVDLLGGAGSLMWVGVVGCGVLGSAWFSLRS